MPVKFPSGNINDRQSASNPLKALENDGYNVSSFTYPIDLTNDPGENHMVVFYINESTNTQFQTNTQQGVINHDINGNAVSLNPTGTSRYNSSKGVSDSLPTNAPTINGTSNVSTFNIRPINRVSTSIALYIPPLVQTSYQTDWGTVYFAAAGGVAKALLNQNGPDVIKALGEVGIGTLSGLLDSAKDAASGKLGITAELEAGVSFGTRALRNPNTEMLFRGIGFRQYQFDFKFTPRSDQESLNVSNIIKAFKFYASPEVRSANNTPRYYIWPAEFDIEFWSNGRLNNFINKISTCACTNVTVNYTGSNGWSAFRPGSLNGMGVETNLSLQFQELEIITKNRVLQGF